MKAVIAKSLNRVVRCSESITVESPDTGNIHDTSSCPNAIVSHHNTLSSSPGAIRIPPREEENLRTVLHRNSSTKLTTKCPVTSKVVLHRTDCHSDIGKYVGLDTLFETIDELNTL